MRYQTPRGHHAPPGTPSTTATTLPARKMPSTPGPGPPGSAWTDIAPPPAPPPFALFDGALPFRYARVLRKLTPVFTAPGLAGRTAGRLIRDAYVSYDDVVRGDEGREFFRIDEDRFVARRAAVPFEPSRFAGVRVTRYTAFPFAFVVAPGGAPVRTLPNGRDEVDRLPRYTRVALLHSGTTSGTTPVTTRIPTRRGWVWRIGDGRYVDENRLRVVRLSPRPPGVPRRARRVVIDTREQTLVAYEGDRPVLATLVSTGKKRYATPRGTYVVYAKYRFDTMDMWSPTGPYYAEDVPWSMYFHRNLALHGTYWHDGFGYGASHGCVNLAPADAEFLFQWSVPWVPPGWHAVATQIGEPATWVEGREGFVRR